MSLLLVVSLELEVTGVMPGTGFIAWEVGSSARVLEYSGLELTIVAKEEDGSNDWDKVERQTEYVSDHVVLQVIYRQSRYAKNDSFGA